MKILQINTVADHGSVPGIMRQLHDAVIAGHGECIIAYGRNSAPAGVNSYHFGAKPDFYAHVLRNFVLGEAGFGSKKPTEKLIRFIRSYRPDVIHLHNLHGFYLNVEVLFTFLKKAAIPVVWTFHDCWPYTGQCTHYMSVACEKWKTGCDNCPIYRSNYPYSLFKDNSRENYRRKKELFCGVPDLTIVTPSKWLSEDVKQSFLKDYPVKVIPNGIDGDTFRFYGRRSLNRENKKILLGVANVWTKNKGLQFFERLARDVGEDYRIVLIGLRPEQRKALSKRFPKERLLPLGYTTGADELCKWYNRATAFINPTLEDNYPTTNLEALACGCPVITFKTGGAAERVTQDTGVAVGVGDYEGLLKAIPIAENLDRQAIADYAARELTSEKMTREYLGLYGKGQIPSCLPAPRYRCV